MPQSWQWVEHSVRRLSYSRAQSLLGSEGSLELYANEMKRLGGLLKPTFEHVR